MLFDNTKLANPPLPGQFRRQTRLRSDLSAQSLLRGLIRPITLRGEAGGVMGSELSPEVIAQHVVGLLPDDGTPVANRIVRTMLARRLEKRIDVALYFEAVDQLSKREVIGRARGSGGSIFLARAGEEVTANQPKATQEEWSEARLMPPLKHYLERYFPQSLDLPKTARTFVADTSAVGPRTGQWARPDFIFISVMPFQLLPGRQVDVHSIELKAEAGGSVQAVHEALAQTRFTNFGHLFWHVTGGSRCEARLPEIESQCDAHGIGLVIIRDPADPSFWETRLDARQKHTPPATIDAFLLSRLGPTHREKLHLAMSEK